MSTTMIDLPRTDDDPRVQEAHAALKAAKKRQDRSQKEYVAAAKALKVLSNKLDNKLDAESVSADDVREAKAAKAKAVERCQQANAAYDKAVVAEKNARKKIRAEIQKLAIGQYEEMMDRLAAAVGPACSEFVEGAEELEQVTRDALGPDPSHQGRNTSPSVFRLGRPAIVRFRNASAVQALAEWAKGRLEE